MNVEQLKKDILALRVEAGYQYQLACLKSYNEIMDDPTASTYKKSIAKADVINTLEDLEAFRKKVAEIRDNALSMIQSYRDELVNSKMEPPTQEAINTVNYLKTATYPKNKDGDRAEYEELQKAMDTYGSNHMICHQILEIAKSKGKGYVDLRKISDVDSKLKDLDELKEKIELMFTVDRITRMKNANGDITILNIYLDGYLS